MALFFLTSLGETALTIDTAIKEKLSPEAVFQIESGKWMVRTDTATSQNLSQILGLTDSQTTHLIISVGGYYGRAAPAL